MAVKKILCFVFCLLCPFMAFAVDDVYSVNQLLETPADNTPCARAIYEKALHDNANLISDPETADTGDIDTWSRFAFSQRDVLTAVLNCPELQNVDDEQAIVFETVSYTFSNGRKIDIDYKTTKKVLLQKLKLAEKRELPGELINPDIYSDAVAGNIWVNVDPLWYAILVAEHGTLDEFVGPSKNNVVALKHIENNVDTFYPKNHSPLFRADCTSRSAIAGDTDMINRAVTITVGGSTKAAKPETPQKQEMQDNAEKNDYYVMGDADLRWISYAEITGDIVLDVLTGGGYVAVKGAIVASRATKVFLKSQKLLKGLKSSKAVARFINVSHDARNITNALNKIDKIEDSAKIVKGMQKSSVQTVKKLEREIEALKNANGSKKQIKSLEKELEFANKHADDVEKAIENADKLSDATRALEQAKSVTPVDAGKVEKLTKQVEELSTTYSKHLGDMKKFHARELKKIEKLDDVKDYKGLAQAKRESAHTLYLLRQGKRALQAKRGLLPVRVFKSAKALRKGLKSSKSLNKSAKIVRANTSGLSAKVSDWLYHTTMRNMGALAKVPAQLAALNTIIKFAGDLYDMTDVSSSAYTNKIDMKPYLLLGADNLEGYENIVNHGMWLFWAGSSTSAADDDAAFLQAMDFAEKFHQDLVEVQDEYDLMSCDVDIYVVRPIIRNPGTDSEELYYLFMNDEPWTTHGYNEPNDGTRPTTIPLKNPDAQTQSNGVVAESGTGSVNATTSVAGRGASLLSYREPPYDGTKIGQACTPPSESAGNFSGAILTTGRYAAYPAFEKAMITKFRTEGGCVDHPADSGGYTCYGVSSKYFPQVRKPGFSRADAEDIAFNNYYKKYNLDRLPDAISGDVFMAMWGMGRDKSIGLLQQILGVPKTNIVDDATVDAAINYKGNLRSEFLDAREKLFKSGQREFQQGWLNALDVYRANGCHTVAGE